MKIYLIISTILSLLVLPLKHIEAEDARASQRLTREKDVNDPESSVTRAADVYGTIIKDAKVPSSVLKNAKCIAVFPNVVTAALAVGGVHGDGLAFCRNTSGKWSKPVFLDLTGGSIGVQAGVKSANVVLYMSGEKAKEAIQKGEFSLTGELSAVAGSFDESYVAPRQGVISYTKTEGAFAGASLGGVNISHDKDEQRAFYGTYDTSSIFEGSIPQKVAESVDRLISMLPTSQNM